MTRGCRTKQIVIKPGSNVIGSGRVYTIWILWICILVETVLLAHIVLIFCVYVCILFFAEVILSQIFEDVRMLRKF